MRYERTFWGFNHSTTSPSLLNSMLMALFPLSFLRLSLLLFAVAVVVAGVDEGNAECGCSRDRVCVNSANSAWGDAGGGVNSFSFFAGGTGARELCWPRFCKELEKYEK